MKVSLSSSLNPAPVANPWRAWLAFALLPCIWSGCTKEPAPPPSPVSGGKTGQANITTADDARPSHAAVPENRSGDDQQVAAPAPTLQSGSDSQSKPAVEPQQGAQAAPPRQGVVPSARGRVAVPSPSAGSEPPKELHPPEVILSQAHEQTCVRGVGEPFPRVALPDLEGKLRELPQLYGDRMTIVVFWTAKQFSAREQFARIMHDCVQRYRDLGVNVVAINVGDAAETVRELADQDEIAIPCLLDEAGQAFRQVATDLLPRTYLLDAEGRILWFDLESSRSQRNELHNAVHYHLRQSGT